MKCLSVIFIIILLISIGCSHMDTIDSVYPWPSSGVPEADSLLLQFERERAMVKNSKTRTNIQEKFCSIARLNPNNHLLQFRDAYLKTCKIPSDDVKSLQRSIDSCLRFVDSIHDPYDWHMISSLKVEVENDVVAKYNRILSNIEFFRRAGSLNEIGRNMNNAGNLMIDLGDTVSARYYYEKCLEIYDSLGSIPNAYIIRLNLGRTVSDVEQAKIYEELRNDSVARNIDDLMVLVYQNSYIYNEDSIQFIDKALDIHKRANIGAGNVPILLALKGDYFTRHGDPLTALTLINQGFDSIKDKGYPSRFLLSMYRTKGYAFYEAGQFDSAAVALNDAMFWQDSLERELNKVGIYRLEGFNRIKMAKQEEALHRYRQAAGFGGAIVLLVIAFLLVVMRIKKLKAEKRLRELKLSQELENGQQALRAQAMVIEENKRLIADISAQLDSLKDQREIDASSADTMVRMLKIHKSNEENRNGFLKMQQELDTDFQKRLRHDFPLLSDGQVKLASLIAAGLDTRQICNILNIEPTSVHKGRYRLRMRLKITGDDNLEEFLRAYNRRLPLD